MTTEPRPVGPGQEDLRDEMPEEFQRLQQLYDKFCGPMSEAVLKARWVRIEPNDLLSWEMRRATSTGLAYMEQELIETFAAIEAAGLSIVATDRLERLLLVTRAAERMLNKPGEVGRNNGYRMLVDAVGNLRPGDLDPLAGVDR